ncbi:hypothetical protein SAMN04490357_1753 [Streptomyces misionensis]|uniref:Uncharacterized protein n=1 Tax=Streptomyces misionensis TaxID=67331 RepID=A0A1H4RPH0_9ACTN|nr:hypothetical protein SAMN04490357_1753 [Streptomyces misionensis]
MAAYLTDPTTYEPPTPVRGCRVCGALQRQIDVVDNPRNKEYDPSKATDLRVEMRRHHSGKEAS